MADIFKAKTKTGQRVMYCIASGPRGKQARRELSRVCEANDIEAIEPSQLSKMPVPYDTAELR